MTNDPQELGTRPGRQSDMRQKPQSKKRDYIGSGKLQDKVALITGGDSGIGRAIAIAFAKEGANVAISYLEEEEDAQQTKRLVETEGSHCLLLPGDIGNKDHCKKIVNQTIQEFGQLDSLINNAAEQHPQDDIGDISQDQLEKTFKTNILSMFYLTQAALPHFNEGATIINTSSVVAFRGQPQLVDYSATKGAIISFTRALALQLAKKKIRVNAVAPGLIWTPLIPSTFPEEEVKTFGQDTALGRPGQPEELAPAYVYLASEDSSYVLGQTIHVNGGEIVGS